MCEHMGISFVIKFNQTDENIVLLSRKVMLFGSLPMLPFIHAFVKQQSYTAAPLSNCETVFSFDVEPVMLAIRPHYFACGCLFVDGWTTRNGRQERPNASWSFLISY